LGLRHCEVRKRLIELWFGSGDYYRGSNSSCALGAAYEGIYRLPDTADGVRPQRLDRGALIVHLNDAHHWTRERIAAWVADPDVPQDESHAHH
jgi:hypothetical protein